MSESLERLARNQSLFREVNERIQYLAEVNERIGYVAEGATSEFVCECSNTECISTIELTVAEYERVRSNPTWFVIKRDHDLAQIERVVSRDDGFAVVEKLIAEEYMQETDPRSDRSEGSGEGYSTG
jgi:thioredoxin-related protein